MAGSSGATCGELCECLTIKEGILLPGVKLSRSSPQQVELVHRLAKCLLSRLPVVGIWVGTGAFTAESLLLETVGLSSLGTRASNPRHRIPSLVRITTKYYRKFFLTHLYSPV